MMSFGLKTNFAAALLIITLAAYAAANSMIQHLGSAGATYELVEADALTEIKEAAARVDWESVLDREKLHEKVRQYRPHDLRRLPRAQQDRVFLADMTYSLKMDIPDGKGGVLYPKGFTFNPLDYVSMNSIFVIIDGADPRQVEWFAASEHAQDLRVRLILSGGDYTALIRALERPVFYLSEIMADRFQLSAVPSVVQQHGRALKVREVYVEETPEKQQ